MDKLEAAQFVLEYIGKHPGCSSGGIIRHIESSGLQTSDRELPSIIEYLRNSGYITGSIATGYVAFNLQTTPLAIALLDSGMTIRERETSLLVPQPMGGSIHIGGNVGNFAHGDNAQQTINNYGVAEEQLSQIIEIMRDCGDSDSADEIAKVQQSNGVPAAIKAVGKRFSEKIQDQAYALEIAPRIAMLLASLPI